MSINKNLFTKGIQQLGILVLLFITAPITLTMAFKALKKFTESPKIYLAYGLFIFSALLIIFSVYFAFKTFRTLLNALFNNS